MIKLKIVIILILSIVSLPSVQAETTGSTRVRLLLEQCGMLDRLREFPRQVFQAMGHKNDTTQPKQYTPERDAIFQAFNIEEMEQELVSQVAKKMDEENKIITLQWYQSPLGKRITTLERSTYSEHAWQRRQIFIRGLEEKYPRQDRVHRIQRLTELNYLAKIDEDLEMTTALALTDAMNATLPSDEHIDPDHIRHSIQVQREDRKEVRKKEQLINFLYLYHQLSDQEIAEYVEFLDSESGKQFNAAMLVSLRSVFHSASEKIGTALGRALKGERRI